jgi:hypothetical protein
MRLVDVQSHDAPGPGRGRGRIEAGHRKARPPEGPERASVAASRICACWAPCSMSLGIIGELLLLSVKSRHENTSTLFRREDREAELDPRVDQALVVDPDGGSAEGPGATPEVDEASQQHHGERLAVPAFVHRAFVEVQRRQPVAGVTEPRRASGRSGAGSGWTPFRQPTNIRWRVQTSRRRRMPTGSPLRAASAWCFVSVGSTDRGRRTVKSSSRWPAGTSASRWVDPRPVSSIYVSDAADAVVAGLVAPPGIYNIVDDGPLTKRGYADALAAAARTTAWVRVPGRAALLLGSRSTSLTRSLRVSNARFKAVTGWSPRFPAHARVGLRQPRSSPQPDVARRRDLYDGPCRTGRSLVRTCGVCQPNRRGNRRRFRVGPLPLRRVVERVASSGPRP